MLLRYDERRARLFRRGSRRVYLKRRRHDGSTDEMSLREFLNIVKEKDPDLSISLSVRKALCRGSLAIQAKP